MVGESYESEELRYDETDDEREEYFRRNHPFISRMLNYFGKGIDLLLNLTGYGKTLDSSLTNRIKPNQLEISVEGKTGKIQACPCQAGKVGVLKNENF